MFKSDNILHEAKWNMNLPPALLDILIFQIKKKETEQSSRHYKCGISRSFRN